MSKGYYQVPVAPNDRDKTAFMSRKGKYRFLRMPFGFKGALSCFQWLMDDILSDIAEFCRAYFDDIVIFSDTWEEHLQHFLQVITCLKHHGLTLKGNKCRIVMTSCSYLGHTVGKGQVTPQMAKVEAV